MCPQVNKRRVKTMTTLNEYAVLSAHIYNNERGVRSEVNTLPLPTGWDKLGTVTGFPAQASYDDNFFSFTAGAYVNSSTGEIVIAYKGTDFLLEFAGRAWNTVGDMLTDLSGGVGGFVSTAQFVQAATYYEEVKKWATDHGYASNKISFTGHSLGAGIASVMSVWFDHPATVFADAPFELTALSKLTQAVVSTALLIKGFDDPEYSLFAAAQTYTAGNIIFNSRESLVTNYYNQGEFLQYLRFGVNTVYGTTNPITIGDQPISRALALHSMNLHAAFLFDDRLRDLATKMPELVPTLLDTKLYAADPNSRTKDLITSLDNDQIRAGLTSDSALKHFTTDLMKLQGTDGAVADPKLRTAMIAAGMDYYFNKTTTDASQFFKLESGGIHFNLDDVNATSLKSLPLLRTAASSTVLGGDPFNTTGLYEATNWHVQSGTSSMYWTASQDADDVAIGGAQADVLRAGIGSDYVVGGAGDDLLDGGAGGDTLLGGPGNDRYEFSGAFGSDTVLDADGGGSLWVDGVQLTGGKKLDTNVWESEDRHYRFSLMGGNLVIGRGSQADADTLKGNITVQGWVNEQLGLHLDNALLPNPAETHTYLGDERPRWLDAFGNYDWAATAWNADGTLGGGVDELNFNDVISRYGIDSVSDKISGLGGNDALDGGAGNDFITGGLGDDDLTGDGGNGLPVGLMHIACNLIPLHSLDGLLRYPLLCSGNPMTTETKLQQHNLMQPCGRTRRASVPARLHARGLGVSCARASSHQLRGWRASDVAAANWLRRSGTATRHVGGLGWSGVENSQAKQVRSMRLTAPKRGFKYGSRSAWTGRIARQYPCRHPRNTHEPSKSTRQSQLRAAQSMAPDFGSRSPVGRCCGGLDLLQPSLPKLVRRSASERWPRHHYSPEARGFRQLRHQPKLGRN
jgi:Ca2+-binding RTX toxin-like protein